MEAGKGGGGARAATPPSTLPGPSLFSGMRSTGRDANPMAHVLAAVGAQVWAGGDGGRARARAPRPRLQRHPALHPPPRSTTTSTTPGA